MLTLLHPRLMITEDSQLILGLQLNLDVILVAEENGGKSA